MSNAHHMPAEGFRTAAYLEARARLDAGKAARKTNRTNVQCTPPNVKCGGRCIPPSWDCRLKGQGTDPHLRAVKTDPLGGLANIQRGVGRISKGVTKGNFSEVEGGKRAVIRGVVKVAPGNLQQKKELRTKLEERTRSISIGLAVVTGGLGVHALLMKTDTFGYRNGAGANINNAVRLGVSRVLDATPVIGANRARVRSAVQTGIEAQLTRQANPVSAALTGQLARTRITEADTDARTNLVRGLAAVNDDHRARGAQADFDAWNRDHQRAFWSATRREDNQEASVFARPATNEFLARQFNLGGDDVLTTRSIKDAVQRQITEHKSSLLDLAQQQGFRVKTARGGARYMEGADQRTFIQGVVRGAVPGGSAATPLRAQLTRDLEETLRRTPKGRADEIYRDTFRSFNDFYTRQASATENAYSASRLTREMRRTGIEQTLMDGRRVRAAYVLGLVRPGSEVRGSAHAELALREYHAREVVGTPRNMYAITDRLATAAASEIEGRPVSLSEAFGVLERAGFTGAVRQSGPPSRTFGRRGQYSSEGEAAYALMRQNPGMTLAAARRAVRRRRSDASPELVRTAAYLAARTDLQEGRLGKPCGASHIPKAHECRKGQSAVEQPPRGAAPRGRAIAAAVALTAGAGLTVGGLLAYRNRTTLVPGLSQDAIRTLSTAQVKAGLDKLPPQLQEPARKLVGDAKLAAAHMALRAQGAQIKAVDVDNNFSTWVTGNGTHLSIGSVGDSLLTFGAERKANVGKFPQFGLGFTINTTYDAEGGMPSGQSRQLIRTTKAMYKAQLDMLPDDAFLFAVPHQADGKGAKRKSIYEGLGFKAIPGLKGDKLWALKNQGEFTEIPENQFDMLRSMIRGDRADATEHPRLGKPCGASHIPKAHECHTGARSSAHRRTLALAVAATGAVALAAALTAKHWTPAAQRILDNARPISKSNPPKGASYLAEGVSGQTWVSKDNKYLIKTPKGKFNRAKFINEVNVQNALSDAGVSVPKVHSVDAKKGIVMMDLLKDYDTLKSLPREKTAASLRTLHKEVEKMHMLGYSHGDLHSGNVLVKGADVKLIDFGNAGPVAKNGLFDINQLLLKAKGADAALYGTLVKHKSTLQSKISSGARLTQQDFLAFHEAVRKDLRSAT